MNFKEKVQSMKFSEIMQAMLDGIKKQHVKIDMDTYGGVYNKECYGCAATNAICEISGKVFTEDNISDKLDRSKFIGVDVNFLQRFEVAIDKLRKGYSNPYNEFASTEFANIPKAFMDDIEYLPWITNMNDCNTGRIQQYQDICDKIKAAGF